MKKLIKILTCVLFLYSNCGFSQNACEEVVLGEIGKSHWRDSWSDGLRGELVKQIQKKDDLFDKLLPEIEFGISPIVDFKFRFTRSVRDHQPTARELASPIEEMVTSIFCPILPKAGSLAVTITAATFFDETSWTGSKPKV